ncbi:MAG: 4-(cytidine 5'-diphospho)-2-C-methyl-D-erythritol kinase [Stygiobacter sp. RIFOXYC12_FULL_38_8]|nr:MAG: 4-(cytidine 5'-diphospho)-2-C-methyl-D-erythritol kinase [Stygiobacter sp. GWC2_38_9]OGU78331.1 MAG: 4-(cytidine 5'-diphospho)-2-C-methyl-D-erythritol kinase [Stygiobacter sp. RIFOXYA12_FULL_38_9]OGV06018.1 MAG: 4-(cytidine 5'-diphospho)-2-C-methyl-D-erythritol kinase [Stygiobacter sp. RIFOXYB2_FULL_37_11]OGV16919.1 MAG: 4-(cytidine 5'-diphospho)-2-C-methyl-D-erythritol kinase [Stygiobacter sp. RIFOXYC2_FULL_38_25]OGV28253.1 MAG: 4-(cytidine 5'-diphospho)-2-C-methyl-D-erythritol kinase 
MKRIEIKAPAKINIGLDVLSKREDGYHNLNTLFYPILDLFDVLIFEWSERFEFICNASSIPNDESNLVVKAAKLLENFSGKSITAKIELRKNIPSQAGLGGGSSDAAATLISINEMFQLGIKYEKMLELALELGSDVPFFIKAKPAIGTSRGEALKMVNVDIEEPILIVNPGINVSTKEAFSNIKGNEAASDFLALITEGKFSYSLARALIKNDFESNVFKLYPEIGEIKKTLYDCGALFALMSGTGSTVYGIFSNIEAAKKAKAYLPRNYFCFTSTPHM